MDVIKNRPLLTVGGLVIAPDGDILLVQSKKWGDRYSLPGGKVEGGESRAAAFQREVLEETGLSITPPRFVMVQESIFSEEFWSKEHFVMHDFIADLAPSFSKTDVLLNDEAYAYRWIAPKEALFLDLHQECRRLIEWYIKDLSSKKQIVIGVDNCQISCTVGIHSEERIQEQLLLVDIQVKTGRLEKGAHELEKTVDYTLLSALATDLAKKKHYLLIESFAEDFVEECLSYFNVDWVRIKIKKPAAISTAQFAYVELEASREDPCVH